MCSGTLSPSSSGISKLPENHFEHMKLREDEA
jgi:hypothetical protein